MRHVLATFLLLSVTSAPVAFAREPASVEAGSRAKGRRVPSPVEKVSPGILMSGGSCTSTCAPKEGSAQNPVIEWIKAAAAKFVS